MSSQGSAGVIRTVIVDDERLSRSRIRELLGAHSDVEVIAESSGGVQAVQTIRETRPDLIFLDVEMPELGGLEIASEVSATEGFRPRIIFVTAFPDYAVRAFDSRATDYLVKPLARDRFAIALDRVRSDRAATAASKRDVDYLDRVALKVGEYLKILRMNEVDYVTGEGNYIRLHVSGESFLHRMTISSLDERLDPARFARIHRSTIVNIDRIDSLHPAFHRDLIVKLRDGTSLRLTAAHRERLQGRIDGL